MGHDRGRALFDLLLMAPVPASGRPAPAEPVRIGVEDSYCSVPGVDAAFGEIYDQDTGNLGWMQEGIRTGAKKGATYANYQEIRIRQIHQTLDKYLGEHGKTPA